MRLIGLMTLATLATTVGCGQEASDQSASRESSAAATPTSALASTAFTPDERIAAALPRGGQSSFTVQAFAGAACSLQDAREAPGASRHVDYQADDDGVVRVTLEHSDATVTDATLALYCRNDAGETKTVALDVTVSDDAVTRAPAPITREGKRTLPRLEGDALALGARELLAKGYPPRPDRAKSPDSYARWLQIVESEPVVVQPRPAIDLGVSFGGQENSGEWCGIVIDSAASAPAFFDVGGTLLLPDSVTFPTSDHVPATIGQWVGFDGDNDGNGVVQNGAAISASVVGGMTAVTVTAFYEWESNANPGGTNAQGVPNFTVGLNDQLQVFTYVFSEVGLAYFYFYDETQHATMTETLNIPPGVVFSGHEAEWIVEWPQGAGNGDGLLDFGLAGVQYAEAYDNANARHTVNTDTALQDNLVNVHNGHLMANAIALPATSTAGSIIFEWDSWN